MGLLSVKIRALSSGVARRTRYRI